MPIIGMQTAPDSVVGVEPWRHSRFVRTAVSESYRHIIRQPD